MTRHDQPDPLAELVAELARGYEGLRVAVATTFEAIRERGCHAVRLPAAGVATGASWRATTVPNTLLGFALREVGGVNPAAVVLHDGPDADADEICAAAVASGGVDRAWFGPGGISLSKGLTLEVLAGGGTVAGVVLLGSA